MSKYEAHAHFTQSYAAVHSTDSPLFPFTMLVPKTPALTRSVLWSIKSALVHATMVGTPAVFYENVPWPNGSVVPWRALSVSRSGLADGSV